MISYDADVTLVQYAILGKKNNFPEIERCPACRGLVRLNAHGYYFRNALQGKLELRVPIRRLKCPACNKTFSLLPDFLLPYFQYTLNDILGALSRSLRGTVSAWRQRFWFYRKRFMAQLNQVEMFFRDEGFREKLPGEYIEKAIKLLEMILALGEAPFVRRSRGHFVNKFMAL